MIYIYRKEKKTKVKGDPSRPVVLDVTSVAVAGLVVGGKAVVCGGSAHFLHPEGHGRGSRIGG